MLASREEENKRMRADNNASHPACAINATLEIRWGYQPQETKKREGKERKDNPSSEEEDEELDDLY